MIPPEEPHPPDPRQLRRLLRTPFHSRLWLVVVGTSTLGIAAFEIVANIVQVWGVPWPTAPSFVPGLPSFGVAFDIPFQVENKSILFGLHNLKIRCRISGKVPDQPTVGGIVLGPNNVVGANGTNELAALSTAPFICPLRGAIRFGDKDG